jgi:hypothetical protein
MGRKTGIFFSIALGLILASAAICVSVSLIFPEIHNKVIQVISDNWLIIIFKIHTKIISSSINPLHQIKIYDILILTLFSFISICLCRITRKLNKIWLLIASSLPVLGILVLLLTQLAGRSAFMASGLIISIVLLSGGSKNKLTGLIGILANTLLLIGDFTAGSNLKIVAPLFGLGYVIEIIWVFMIVSFFHSFSPDENG